MRPWGCCGRRRRREQLQELLPQDDETENEDGEGEGTSETDAAVALATAQSIITAADITLPTGDLAQGAYDALGNYYPIPEHVVSDPVNILRRPGSEDHGDAIGDTKSYLTGGEEAAGEGDLEGEDEAERRREEKGKAVVDARDQIMVRARLSDGSKDVSIAVGKTDSVRSIAEARCRRSRGK